ncbi:NFX1-type zinc finger-containing protein 1-like isoform X2 [Aricia agestis]|uniref:NFX1-type zinc finger-containing protein 1-like isoform X2 n=1 Tax=Aricia agestis TaxID=91739 RepID=UPI001C20C26C|nr:NFX1-type zinc finger-containing protein 1-like isoform X2 [Aricia agestis]
MSKSYRIDWFDGSVIEDRPTASTTVEPQRAQSPKDTKEGNVKKAIGFIKLYEISQLESPILNLELEARPGFWLLFSSGLSDDFIVLIVKTLKTLYKSLEKNDSFKLFQLLETKFMESDFFNKLHDYVKKLPDVRLSQKSRNSQLWNDVNGFFSDLLDFCKGIFNFYKNRREYLKKLEKVVEVTYVSAFGVAENHSESISSNFYQNIAILQEDLRKTLTDTSNNPSQMNPSTRTTTKSAKTTTEKDISLKDFSDILDDGNKHYQDLSIVPNLSYFSLQYVNSIKPNITGGAYESVEHYLDIQFKLLREDCYRTLKEGINQYREYKTLKNCKDANIRVYNNVSVTDIQLAMNHLGYVVDLGRCPDLEAYNTKKSFMHGSLLILTWDNFETMLCGTVITNIGDNKLVVEFDGKLRVDFKEYTMVESDVYFEPYHKVLKVLKQARPPIPMQKYIVYVDKKILPPAYLNLNTVYTITNHIGKEHRFSVLTPNWPTAAQCGLDDSQMEAFRFALTREFVVIQGPPGTGKTYLGTRIAGTLLSNVSFAGSPMLVICCTNHALDQFLEGLLTYTNRLVRIGGQSKSKILQNYNLRNLQAPKTFGKIYYHKRKELDRILSEFKTLAEKDQAYREYVVSYDTMKRYIKDPYVFGDGEGFADLFDNSDKDIVTNAEFLHWLLGHKCEMETKDIHDLVTCFSLRQAKDEIKKRKKEIELMKSNACDFASSPIETERLAEERIKALEDLLAAFEKMMAWPFREKCIQDEEPLNIPMTDQEKRWYAYFRMIHSVQQYHNHMKISLYRQYLETSRELERLRDSTDCEKLKGVKVVGMTTTMAAARHGLLEKLKSFVVVVEEAAEVLESHIVAALTDECKHLILIGDHQQLRPNSAHYIIGKKYNLEVSLFERMVKNGVHTKTLTIQRRMRPEIRDLLVPTIYEKLDCHPAVLSYPNVRGMSKNLYFFDHNHFEEIEANGSSYMNKSEAYWCVSLAHLFVTLGYDPSEITIIATYSAQVALIVQRKKDYSLTRDVHVTTVDNYQGEENRIVILSLVRSNAEKNVGFLSTPNRVCVALSRAREGLYIFGNMSCLETSPMWMAMKTKLQAQNAIGRKHRLLINDKEYEVGTTKELDNICNTMLELQL